MAAALFFLLFITGCTTVPPASGDSAVARDEMASHVAFLSQPALKGRKPRTHGSRLAREYIEARFKAYGLVPWQQSDGYELSFRFGRNVVGVLRGTDTNLAREVVMLSAHYDHLGKEKGKINPGAADNASGVAALLETARQLSRSSARPRRSIAFVAFDCEEQMALGSLAFSTRQDVRQAQISAIVNLDMLGRDFMDVVSNTIFVTGTEEYPNLRAQVRQSGSAAGIRVLPVGSDLIGPRGDHVVFESLGVPCLFFSCGTCRDYHKPTDTADKLNYATLGRSAEVIVRTVRELANAESTKPAPLPASGDLEELRTLTSVLPEVLAHAREAGVKKDDVKKFGELESKAENLLRSGRYDRRTRQDFIMEADAVIAPYLDPTDELGMQNGNPQQQPMLALIEYFYLNYHNEIIDGFKKLMAQVLKDRPGLIRGMHGFKYEFYDIADDDIRLTEIRPGTHQLSALGFGITITAQVKRSKWGINSFGGNLACSVFGIQCDGSDEQLADYCLLLIGKSEGENASYLAYAKKLREILSAVSKASATGSFPELLDARLKRGGFDSAMEWIVHCIETGTPALAEEALRADLNYSDRFRDAACRVVVDPGINPNVRAAAIRVAMKRLDRRSLMAVSSVLGDTTMSDQIEYNAALSKDSPFAEKMVINALRAADKDFDKPPHAPKPLGALAREQLKQATRRDFGQDVHAWQHWIEGHFKK